MNEKTLRKMCETNTTKLVENTGNFISGNEAQKALFCFTNACPEINIDTLREQAIQKLQQTPEEACFPFAVYSPDLRLVAIRPAFTDGKESEMDEIVIRYEMISLYGNLRKNAVKDDILPALDMLQLEHQLLESDFIELVKNSSIFPKERASLFAKALFFGYQRDFVTALHLLIPQIEHLVRVYLKHAGVDTANIDDYGIVKENGMSTLMTPKNANPVFGENLAFELRSIFCDAFGPNLRNELAHGLLEESDCKSFNSIYAWWLSLRLICNPWLLSTDITIEPRTGEEI